MGVLVGVSTPIKQGVNMDVQYEIKQIHKKLKEIEEIVKQLQEYMNDAYNRELIVKDY